MARTKKIVAAAPVAETAPEEEQIPHYETSKTEQYLNFILGSSETFPQNPSSRLEEYLYYLCKYGSDIGLKAKKVDVLPEVGKGNILYLVPKQDDEITNICDEYLWIDDAFELVGTTKVDLSNYYTKIQTEKLILDAHFTVISDTTMQTSTLPAIAVPALTSEQLSQLLTAFSQEKVCYIKTGDEVLNINQSDSENGEIKVWYHGYYLTYVLNGSTVTAEYLQIPTSSGIKLYKHKMKLSNNEYVVCIAISSTPFESISEANQSNTRISPLYYSQYSQQFLGFIVTGMSSFTPSGTLYYGYSNNSSYTSVRQGSVSLTSYEVTDTVTEL